MNHSSTSLAPSPGLPSASATAARPRSRARSLTDNARILRYAFISAMADWRMMYNWRTWLLAWLVRIMAQVTMFALIGRMLDSPDRTRYLVVGNAVFVVATPVMLVCASTAWERMAGTVPLLVASPASPFTVFAGRSVEWILDGLACSTISLFLLAPLFGVTLPMPAAFLTIPVILLIGISVYFFGLFLAAFVLRAMHLRSFVGNIGSLVLMVVTGVQVPVSFWPDPVRFATQVLPVTHGLQGVRVLLDGGPLSTVGADCAAEAAVLLGWLLAAWVAFRVFTEGGRADGSIEFGG